jgi:hypothetical protein
MRMLIFVAILIAGGLFGSKLYVEHKAASNLDAVIAQLRPYVDLTYGKVTTSLTGELEIERIRGKFADFEDPFTIESVTLITPGFGFLLGFDKRVRDFDVPESFGVEIAGFRTSIGADFMEPLDDLRRAGLAGVEPSAAERCIGTYGFSPEDFRDLGYDELAMDVRMAYSRDGNRVKLAVASHNEDMYDVDLALTFGGISDPTELARGAAPVLIEARVDYVDRSMNGRIMKRCTEQHGVTADEVLAAQTLELQTLARNSGMELDPAILDPYAAFLQGRQRFTITSKPLEPVDLRHIKLYKPSDVPNLLNLMAEVN